MYAIQKIGCLGLILFSLLSTRSAMAQTLTALHIFAGGQSDAALPAGGLAYFGGYLYGVSRGGGGVQCPDDQQQKSCGTVYSIDAHTGYSKILHRFTGGSDGSLPNGKLLFRDRYLYGATEKGGSANKGTIFQIYLGTGAETVLHSFQGGTAAAQPTGGLIEGGGHLFGTANGGKYGYGVIFKISLATGAETDLYSFTGGEGGAVPAEGLTYLNGFLYGTTTEGGSGGRGTIFKVNANLGTGGIIYRFAGQTDGGEPRGALSIYAGVLYGTTANGPQLEEFGTVFEITATGRQESVVHSFNPNPYSNGNFPEGYLAAENGMLYGTTFAGGVLGPTGNYGGVLYAMNPVSGAETVLHAFTGDADGGRPAAGVLDAGGTLYGTTTVGGGRGCGCGSVFTYTP